MNRPEFMEKDKDKQWYHPSKPKDRLTDPTKNDPAMKGRWTIDPSFGDGKSYKKINKNGNP